GRTAGHVFVFGGHGYGYVQTSTGMGGAGRRQGDSIHSAIYATGRPSGAGVIPGRRISERIALPGGIVQPGCCAEAMPSRMTLQACCISSSLIVSGGAMRSAVSQ